MFALTSGSCVEYLCSQAVIAKRSQGGILVTLKVQKQFQVKSVIYEKGWNSETKKHSLPHILHSRKLFWNRRYLHIIFNISQLIQSLDCIKDNKLLDTQTYFCVSISHVEISCNKLLISVNFGNFAYLVLIIFGLHWPLYTSNI